MEGDPLLDLVKEADAAVQPPVLPQDLARQVRGWLRRRRRVRLAGLGAGGAAAAVLAVVLAVGRLAPERPPAEPPALSLADLQSRVAQLQREAGALRSESEAQAAQVRDLLARERREARLAQLRRRIAAQPDPRAWIDEQVDRAAAITVYQADRLAREMNLPGPAREAYERTIQLFPDTPWAEVARRRLAELEGDSADAG